MEYSREQYQLSIEELQKKLEQNPHDDAVAFEYAEKQYQLGNLAQSQELLMPLLVRDNPLPQAILLLAQMQYVCGNYAEAEALFLALGTRFPEFSEKAELGLGLVYYQTNQFKKALALSTDSPDNIIAILQAYGDIEPYRVEWGEAGSISIPFFRTEPVPVIQAEIAGKLYNFIIDSGVGDIHLDESLAASLGIDILGKYMGAFAGGEAAEIQYGLLKSMALKDLRIESVPVSLLPSTSAKAIAAVFKKEKLKIDGIMGVSVFKQFMTTLDYPASRLILRPKDAQMDENASEMPFMLAFTHFIMGRGEINGKEVNIFLNSGLPADAALILPDDTVHYANIPVAKKGPPVGASGGGRKKLGMGRLNVDLFKLGDLPEAGDISGLSGVFPEPLYFNSDIGIFIDALISHVFLKNYKWTIDFDSMVIRFSK